MSPMKLPRRDVYSLRTTFEDGAASRVVRPNGAIVACVAPRTKQFRVQSACTLLSGSDLIFWRAGDHRPGRRPWHRAAGLNLLCDVQPALPIAYLTLG